MSKIVYDAVISQLRGEAQEALGMIQHLLETPSIGRDSTHTAQIKEYAHKLVTAEGALLTMQQYFNQQFYPPVEAPPGPPTVVTPEMSPTMREALESEKIKAEAKKRRKNPKKKDDS